MAPDPKQIADDAMDGKKGVLAAHRAGWPCIPVPNESTRGNDFALATRVVDNLDQVSAELIEELVGLVKA